MMFQGPRLFAKIVLWFLTTVILIGGVLSGMLYFVHRNSEDDRLTVLREALMEQGTFIINTLETSNGVERERLEQIHGVPIWIYDSGGARIFSPRRIFGPPASPGRGLENRAFAHAYDRRNRDQNHDRDNDLNRDRQFESVVGSCVLNLSWATESFQLVQAQDSSFLALRIVSESGKSYTAFHLLRRNSFFRFPRFIMDNSLGNWTLVIFFLIGLLCFWLAQSLARPIIEFQGMTRSIARGDFSARLSRDLTERFDELGDLGTDFNMMAEKVEKTINGQRQLLWDISHELRTPMTRISLALELVRNAPSEKRVVLVEKMERNLKRLDGLIQQILDFSRLDQRMEISRSLKCIDIVALVSALLEDSKFEIDIQKKSIHAELPDESIFVSGSEELLRRAFENIIRNALRFSPENGIVDVAIERQSREGKESVLLTIKDSGPGVPAECLFKIFEPFFQCKERGATESGGIGLGLAIVHRAVLVHGGVVTARNADPTGLVVEVHLPVADDKMTGVVEHPHEDRCFSPG
ncbi:MAG: ATP-binding protein [Candidatus Ozemobacteraceae bacterium]